MQANFVRNNKPLINGIYKVKPSTSVELNVYCDMTNFNGGWTLIVASDTNSWTKNNLLERNSNKPNLNEDYSILKYANLIKENYLIGDSNFEYRLEANDAGKTSFSKHYLLKFNNRNIGKRREMCAKLTVKTSKGHHLRRSDIAIVNTSSTYICLYMYILIHLTIIALYAHIHIYIHSIHPYILTYLHTVVSWCFDMVFTYILIYCILNTV